jgi:hypothetical protein
VAHACDPNYSGGRGQEDCGSKPARANSSPDPTLKNTFKKRSTGVAQGVDPECKPHYHEKTKDEQQQQN